MHKIIITILIFLIPFLTNAQNRSSSDWINFGSSHASKWLQIAPGKLGPNALIVPRMDYAKIGNESKLEIGSHYHQMRGDTAINTFISYYWNIAPGRAAVEIYGYPTETFRTSNDVRDERQIYLDDNGWVTHGGDLLISTYIQILKGQKFLPDVTINYSLKTTTGSNRHGRYTDASMNYFYFAMGKSFFFENLFLDEVRLATLCGFYVWQTNKVEMAQDEGPVFEFGLQLKKDWFNFYTELGGYKGYNAYNFLNRLYDEKIIFGNNDPLIVRTRIEKTGNRFNFTAEYQHGFRDYHYQTFRLGVIYHFDAN
ncbi:MAG: hypothetical protein PF541_02385 [Prolixibacteraceae bacterium]|jgi:hypothetical protein|nr:hypothetical protein [Prolixibacteraceae bacterium]